MDKTELVFISDEISTREELYKAFSKYLMLPKKNKRYSDNYSVEMFGYNVPTMFEMMKETLSEETGLREKMTLHEGAPTLISESFVVSEPDLYYNKDAFDSGDVNLCFVIGYSGSGKSVLTREYQGEGIEKVELDDIVCIKDHRTMEDLKENNPILYDFFSGEGSKYYTSRDERSIREDHSDVFVTFTRFAMDYVKTHKEKRYILEGIWTYLFFDDPSEFDDYAVFMKGTSLAKSKVRRMKRELSAGTGSTIDKIMEFGYYFTDSMLHAGNVDVWRRYFEKKPETKLIEEDNKSNRIKASIMNEINSINACFVNKDKAGIEEIMKNAENSTDMSLTEKTIIIKECKSAILEMK